jgi:hypothetical protein
MTVNNSDNTMKYHIQEGSFEIPSDWRDITMNEFHGPVENGFELSINRSAKYEQPSPAARMKSLKRMLGNIDERFELISEEDFKLSGSLASTIEYRGIEEGESYHAALVEIFHRPGESFGFLAFAPDSVWARYAPGFKHAVASLKLASGEDTAPDTGVRPSDRKGAIEYRIPEGSFEIPSDWIDLTMNDFRGSPGDQFQLKIVRNRGVEEPFPEETMKAVRAKHARFFESFEVIFEENLVLSGAPANRIEYRATGDEEEYHGTTVLIFHQPGKSLKLNAFAPKAVWPKYAPSVGRVISSLELVTQGK